MRRAAILSSANMSLAAFTPPPPSAFRKRRWSFCLGNRVMACFAQGFQSLRAVAAHAGEQHAHRLATPLFGDAAEKTSTDGQYEVSTGCVVYPSCVGLNDDQMPVTSGFEAHVPGCNLSPSAATRTCNFVCVANQWSDLRRIVCPHAAQ